MIPFFLFFNCKGTGQYVEPGPFAHGYPSGYDKWQVWGKGINSQYPKGTFTAEEYLKPGNLGSVTKRAVLCNIDESIRYCCMG